MTEQDEEKSLSSWRLDLQRYGKKHWLVFYRTLLALPVSNNPRFFKALNMYGDWAMFESIVATSQAQIKDDPLNYVVKVASIKWKEAQLAEDEEAEYIQELRTAIEETRKRNEEQAKKLKRKK